MPPEEEEEHEKGPMAKAQAPHWPQMKEESLRDERFGWDCQRQV